MQLRDSQQTLVTLANAAELACCIAKEVMGNEVADTLNGSELTRSALHSLAMAHFQRQFASYLGGQRHVVA